eukprot:481469_1
MSRKQGKRTRRQSKEEDEPPLKKLKLNDTKQETQFVQHLFAKHRISIDFSKNDIVFPLFSTIKYDLLTNIFSISLPLYLQEWLIKICRIVLKSDLLLVKYSFSWI